MVTASQHYRCLKHRLPERRADHAITGPAGADLIYVGDGAVVSCSVCCAPSRLMSLVAVKVAGRIAQILSFFGWLAPHQYGLH